MERVPTLTRYHVDPCNGEESARHARLLLQRPRASANALIHNPFRALDHIPLIQCAGGEYTHCVEVQQLVRSLQGKWAECVHLIVRHLLDVSTTSTATPCATDMDEDPLDLEMERAMKLLILLGFLIQRKPLSSTSPSATTKILRNLMDLLLAKDIEALVALYEADIGTKKATSAHQPQVQDKSKK